IFCRLFWQDASKARWRLPEPDRQYSVVNMTSSATTITNSMRENAPHSHLILRLAQGYNRGESATVQPANFVPPFIITLYSASGPAAIRITNCLRQLNRVVSRSLCAPNRILAIGAFGKLGMRGWRLAGQARDLLQLRVCVRRGLWQ